MQPSDKFRIGTFLVIVDRLLTALSKRQTAYMKLKDIFGFLRHLPTLTAEEIRAGASKLIEAYPEDVENEVEEELIQFSELLKTDSIVDIVSESQQNIYELRLYRLIVHNSFASCFPNVEIVLKIYLTLMVTNSGERSFSKLKRIKNEVRATMKQARLNYLSLMSIEHELLREMNMSRIIDAFSVAKSRKCLM